MIQQKRNPLAESAGRDDGGSAGTNHRLRATREEDAVGFWKDVGVGLGSAVGEVVGGAVKWVGDMTESDFVREVGDGVKASTEFTGALLGDVVEGSVTAVEGMLSSDGTAVDAGLDQVWGAGARTAQGIGQSVGAAIDSGGDIVAGVLTDDMDRAAQGARSLGKTVAVGALAIGVVDLAVGVDVAPDADAAMSDGAGELVASNAEVPDPPTPEGVHFVDPHYVSGYTTADGTEVAGYWRDGDGDTSHDLSKGEGGGYLRGDPDGDPTNNLG
jgi:hypothetical protein